MLIRRGTHFGHYICIYPFFICLLERLSFGRKETATLFIARIDKNYCCQTYFGRMEARDRSHTKRKRKQASKASEAKARKQGWAMSQEDSQGKLNLKGMSRPGKDRQIEERYCIDLSYIVAKQRYRQISIHVGIYIGRE